MRISHKLILQIGAAFARIQTKVFLQARLLLAKRSPSGVESDHTNASRGLEPSCLFLANSCSL